MICELVVVIPITEVECYIRHHSAIRNHWQMSMLDFFPSHNWLETSLMLQLRHSWFWHPTQLTEQQGHRRLCFHANGWMTGFVCVLHLLLSHCKHGGLRHTSTALSGCISLICASTHPYAAEAYAPWWHAGSHPGVVSLYRTARLVMARCSYALRVAVAFDFSCLSLVVMAWRSEGISPCLGSDSLFRP